MPKELIIVTEEEPRKKPPNYDEKREIVESPTRFLPFEGKKAAKQLETLQALAHGDNPVVVVIPFEAIKAGLSQKAKVQTAETTATENK